MSANPPPAVWWIDDGEPYLHQLPLLRESVEEAQRTAVDAWNEMNPGERGEFAWVAAEDAGPGGGDLELVANGRLTGIALRQVPVGPAA